MGRMTSKKWEEANSRKSERYSEYGRLFELEVEKLLNKMKENGKIFSFVRHLPHTPEDLAGKDFTVTKLVNGQTLEISFGVTISARQRQLNEHKMCHPNVPQFRFPIGTNPSTIEKRILELFS